MLKSLSIIGKSLISITVWALPLSVYADLQITELLPNPAGDDAAEWIELYNSGDDEISTEGWKIIIKDRSSSLSTKIIPPKNYSTFSKTESKFTLTNTGATVSLISPAGSVESLVTYNKAAEGQSYVLIGKDWNWTQSPTPAQANILSTVNKNSPISKASEVNSWVTIDQVASLKSGTKILTKGIVVAAPGELGESLVFLNGLQLNLTAGNWPELERGNFISVSGSVSHTKTYGNRLNVNAPENIQIINRSADLPATTLNLAEITNEHEGLLVATSGKVINRGNNWFDLKDNDHTIRITLRNRDLVWPKLTDKNITITGLVTLNNNEIRL